MATVPTTRSFERRLIGALIALVLGAFVAGCSNRDLGAAFRVLNDTDHPVEIWVVHGGVEHEPDGDNHRVDPGAEHEFGLAGIGKPDDAQELLCTDGDVIARADDGTEIRIPPPVCDGENLHLSDHAAPS